PAGTAAPAAPVPAHDARAVTAGSGDLETGDPGDQPRAQQLAGADLFAGAFRRRAGAAWQPGAPARRVRHHRRARQASARLHRRLRQLRQAAGTAAADGGVGTVPCLTGVALPLPACRAGTCASGPFRPGADRAGADQPDQERARIRWRGGRGKPDPPRCRQRAAHRGGRSRPRHERNRAGAGAAAVLFHQALRYRPRPCVGARDRRGARRPRAAGQPRRRRPAREPTPAADRRALDAVAGAAVGAASAAILTTPVAAEAAPTTTDALAYTAALTGEWSGSWDSFLHWSSWCWWWSPCSRWCASCRRATNGRWRPSASTPARSRRACIC